MMRSNGLYNDPLEINCQKNDDTASRVTFKALSRLGGYLKYQTLSYEVKSKNSRT